MPRRLIDVERLLVNRHCTIGSGLLKDVKLPWPIADAILHHHERLDGSGYPDALQGDQISMEARIIGLADTVEAMSNHRPYRAGLGIEVALEEIQRGRGSKYDADAVDACLKLFRESGFKFTDPPA